MAYPTLFRSKLLFLVLSLSACGRSELENGLEGSPDAPPWPTGGASGSGGSDGSGNNDGSGGNDPGEFPEGGAGGATPVFDDEPRYAIFTTFVGGWTSRKGLYLYDYRRPERDPVLLLDTFASLKYDFSPKGRWLRILEGNPPTHVVLDLDSSSPTTQRPVTADPGEGNWLISLDDRWFATVVEEPGGKKLWLTDVSEGLPADPVLATDVAELVGWLTNDTLLILTPAQQAALVRTGEATPEVQLLPEIAIDPGSRHLQRGPDRSFFRTPGGAYLIEHQSGQVEDVTSPNVWWFSPSFDLAIAGEGPPFELRVVDGLSVSEPLLPFTPYAGYNGLYYEWNAGHRSRMAATLESDRVHLYRIQETAPGVFDAQGEEVPGDYPEPNWVRILRDDRWLAFHAGGSTWMSRIGENGGVDPAVELPGSGHFSPDARYAMVRTSGPKPVNFVTLNDAMPLEVRPVDLLADWVEFEFSADSEHALLVVGHESVGRALFLAWPDRPDQKPHLVMNCKSPPSVPRCPNLFQLQPLR